MFKYWLVKYTSCRLWHRGSTFSHNNSSTCWTCWNVMMLKYSILLYMAFRLRHTGEVNISTNWKCWNVRMLTGWHVEYMDFILWHNGGRGQHFNISTCWTYWNVEMFYTWLIDSDTRGSVSTFQHFSILESLQYWNIEWMTCRLRHGGRHSNILEIVECWNV